MKLELLEINRRGDQNFDALSEAEKNLYVLFLFVTLHEMEGITHFFTCHLSHLPRLLAFLAETKAPNWSAVNELAQFLRTHAGGAWDSDAAARSFCNMSSEDNAKMNVLANEYYANVQGMWARVKEYVREQYHHAELSYADGRRTQIAV